MQLKNNKAPGIDELLRQGAPETARLMHGFLIGVWTHEVIPEHWKTGIKCPIHKKNIVLDWDKYMAATLLLHSV